VSWETSGDVRTFLDAAGAFMRAQPVQHTVLLTVAETVALRGPNTFGDEAPEFGWWHADGRVDGAFVHTPPYPVLIGPMPTEAAEALLSAVADRPLTGVHGPPELVTLVAARHGGPMQERRREYLYRLGTLIEPPPPVGRWVIAGAAHRGVLIDFYDAFREEIDEPSRDWGPMVDDRLSHRGLHLWLLDDGTAVSMVGISRPIAGMARIGPVYTPPEHRGRGYAAALTAVVSRAAREDGVAEILLFADLANATSNGVYQRIGFEPVTERLALDF
jgi:RimJ/RimL family protein N-acetyltransferase